MKVMRLVLIAGVALAAAAGAQAQAPLLVRMAFNDEAGSPSLANRGLISVSGSFNDGAGYAADVPPVNTGGRSVDFPGNVNNWVSLGSRPELQSMKSLTITAWIKPRTVLENKYPRIVSSDNGSFVLSLGGVTSDAGVTNRAEFFINSTAYRSTHLFVTNVWTFLAVTYDGTTSSGNLKYYVGDGNALTLDSTHNAAAGSSGSFSTFYIGGNGSISRYFNGLMDDVRVYGMHEGGGGVLSSQQVFAVMQQVDHVADDVSWIPPGDLYVAHGPSLSNGVVRRYTLAGGTATASGDVLAGLDRLSGLAVDAGGSLYAGDMDNKQIRNSTGLAIGQGLGSLHATLPRTPYHIAFRPGSSDLYAAELDNNQVAWYNASGTLLGSIASLAQVHGIAFDGADTLYAIGSAFMCRYNWNGSTWAAAWTNSTGWDTGRGVIVSGDHLYALDGISYLRVSRVNKSTGAVLSRWFGASGRATSGFADAAGTLYFPSRNGTTLHAHRTGASGDIADFRLLASGLTSSMVGIHGGLQFGPFVENAAATNVTTASAWLNGAVTATNGQETSAWVYWGLTDGGTNAAAWAATNAFNVVGEGSLTHQATGLVEGRSYFFRFAASNEAGLAWAPESAVFITGPLTLAATVSRTIRSSLIPGVFTVSRPSAATNGALLVGYSVSGDAVAGTDYTVLSGSVTIPDGQTSATVDVYALEATGGGDTVVLTLDPAGHSGGSANATVFLHEPVVVPVSGYRTAFTSSTPPSNWRYQWNQNSAIGNAAGYVDLLWNAAGSRYTVNGDPSGTGGNYTQMTSTGGHPGPGTTQPESLGANRMAIAGYEVQLDGEYRLSDSWVYRISTDTTGPNGARVHVYVNNTFVTSTPLTYYPTTNSFDTGLGALTAGDVVYVALDPAGNHVSDMTSWDFMIERYVPYAVPVVENAIGGATNVTTTSAWLNGNLIATNNSETSAWVFWGQSDGGTNAADWTATNAFSVVGEGALTHQATGLQAGKVYYYRYMASNTFGRAWAPASSGFITAGLTVTAPVATARVGGSAGRFRIARSSSVAATALTVNYTLSGTAVNGTDFTLLPGTATLAAGASEVLVDVNAAMEAPDGVTVVMTLAAGPYLIGSPSAATVTVDAEFDIVAAFRADYTPTNVPAGWRYQWNKNSVIGITNGYADLVWSSALNHYNGDGGASLPRTVANAAYLNISATSVQPGPSTVDSATTARAAIAGYEIAEGGLYSIVDSLVYRRYNASDAGDGVRVRVYVNDTHINTTPTTIHPTTNTFNWALGTLVAGDVVYVALDPIASQGWDGTDLDFVIRKLVPPPKGTMIMFQ